MSVLPCPNSIGCDSDYPVSNYSSEDADPRSFIGYSTGTAPTSSFTKGGGGGPPSGGPDQNDTGGGVDGAIGTAQTGTGGDPPPLGSDYDNAIVTTFAESTESQAAAWDAAGNDNVSAMTVGSNTGEPGGGIILNPSRQRPAVYGNEAQTCSVTCPDGQLFSYTVPANAFRQLSLAKANAAARSQACKLAALNQICLGSIEENATVGVLYDQSIVATTVNIPVTFTIISGDIPDWITATVGDDSVRLVGTPAGGDVGSTSFTIQAVDVLGGTMTRGYTITVSSGDACDPVAIPAVQVFLTNAAASVFCNKTGTVFCIDGTTYQSILEVNTSGVVVNGILIGGNIGCIFYENFNQRLYVGYNSGGTFRIASYNPSTRALINSVALTGIVSAVSLPNRMTYDSVRNKIWVSDGSNYVWSLNANTLSQSVVETSGGIFESGTGMVYCANQDKIVMLGSINHAGDIIPGPPTLGISVWNPAVMSFTYIDATGQANGEEICYNANNGLAYGTTTPQFGVTNGKVLVIDPGNIAAFVTVDLSTSEFAWSAGYNPCTDKVIAIAEKSGALKAYYIDPANNTVGSIVAVGSALSTSENPMTYDAINARLWMGTGATTLLKIT